MDTGIEIIDVVGPADPILTEAEVAGLYPPDAAMVASRLTACDPGSGPARIDD